MIVRFVGPQGVPLAGRFIYPGETRDVSDVQLLGAVQAHPGWFEVDGVPVFQPPLESSDVPGQGDGFPPEALGNDAVDGEGVSLPSPIEPVLEHGDDVILGDDALTPDPLPEGEGASEVSDVSSVEHVDQPVAKRRSGKKQRTE